MDLRERLRERGKELQRRKHSDDQVPVMRRYAHWTRNHRVLYAIPAVYLLIIVLSLFAAPFSPIRLLGMPVCAGMVAMHVAAGRTTRVATVVLCEVGMVILFFGSFALITALLG